MIIRILGGCQVGASAAENLVVDGNGVVRHLLFDSGMKYGARVREAGHLPPYYVDAVAISHSHRDHVGYLPWIMRQYRRARLYMSRPTVYFTQIGWDDSYKIFKKELRRNPVNLALLDEFSEGIAAAGQMLSIIEEPGTIEVFPGVFMTVGPSGHQPGAMWGMIEAEGKSILYSGDMTFQDRPTVKGTVLEEFPKRKIALLLMDSTNGANDNPQLESEELRLVEDVCRATSEGRPVFIAALSQGRLPDIVLLLAHHGISSYVDGLGKRTLEETLGPDGRWSSHEDLVQFEEELPSFQNGRVYAYKVNGARIRMIENEYQRWKLLDSTESKVIVAPSGMLTGGWSVKYAAHFLENPAALVCLTSYQAEETPGRELKEKKETGGTLRLTDFDDREFSVTIRAQVGDYNFSSHAGASEIVEMVKYLNPARTALVHGETQGRLELKARLANGGYYNTLVPTDGDEIEV